MRKVFSIKKCFSLLFLVITQTVPDWALHCTENPEITVQYISDSGAVQLSRHCQDNVYKEISCQGKMNQMAMYEELKCPEEQATSTTTMTMEPTIVEISSTTEESRPEVIIKNPQKMLEDVFNNIETNIEVDSNRLDVVDAKKELDFMVGDQPAADNTEDKKTLLKMTEKKEVYPKKSKNAKKESKKLPFDDEPMMGDAPAEDVAHGELTTIASSKHDDSTTDRQRRDAETTLPADAKATSEEPLSSTDEAVTTTEDASTMTTEAQQITTVVTEETTTKNIVQGQPMFHNHAVFKEPISVDNNNGTIERKDVSNSDDHFIPPMLLVKARFTATKSTEGTEETKEMTTATDEITTSAITESVSETAVTGTSDDDKNVTVTTTKAPESNDIASNEISSSSSVTQVETSPALTSEKPILIEKRNDPRLGLNYGITTSTNAPLSTTEVLSASSTTEEATTIIEETSSSSVSSYESSVSEISTTESQTEMSEMSSDSSTSESLSTQLFDTATSTQPEMTAERLIESTTTTTTTTEKVEASSSLASSSVTPIAIKLTTLKIPDTSTHKPINKSTTQMRNDIDEFPRHPESHESSHELHESSDENDGSSSEQHHLANNLNNEENFQPYKPNRHRTHLKLEHQHGAGFSIGRILG